MDLEAKKQYLKPYADILRDGKKLFRDSMADEMVELGRLPCGKAFDITVSIIAEQKGPIGTAKYEIEYRLIRAVFMQFKIATSVSIKDEQYNS